MKKLDVEAVHAFVLVVELKSFTRAAEAMDSTQSAVSLKIRRLEEMLGRRLLERTPRLVRLSAEGGAFLAKARALVIAHQGALTSFDAGRRHLTVGISHHVIGPELPMLLRRVSDAEPGLALEIRVARSQDILNDFDRGILDAAIVLKQNDRREGEIVVSEAFGWMAAPDFEHRPGEPLRIAAQAEPCSVRDMAIAALDRAKIGWTEVFTGGGVLMIGAAVSAGLAVAALGRRVAPPGVIDIGSMIGLPPLPARDVMLYSNLTDRHTRHSLKVLTAAIRSTALRT
ncbi:LysR family transcriptional regulator [Pandoraea sp. NPDC087047]|uniref:LysR family transcriptional regulator n=1 Tax=Pandoraea sp. NPDC087047 TaxID=3364390 RepID=UPI0037F34708